MVHPSMSILLSVFKRMHGQNVSREEESGQREIIYKVVN
jgi:hypothetical protein